MSTTGLPKSRGMYASALFATLQSSTMSLSVKATWTAAKKVLTQVSRCFWC
ncbi:MAG: hypothetical protein WCC25_17590 [Candidatus Korobacteraceae bacterium]